MASGIVKNGGKQIKNEFCPHHFLTFCAFPSLEWEVLHRRGGMDGKGLQVPSLPLTTALDFPFLLLFPSLSPQAAEGNPGSSRSQSSLDFLLLTP